MDTLMETKADYEIKQAVPDTPEKGSPVTELVRPKARNVYRDALFFSKLVLDKRFTRTVRYVDWVDMDAGPSETFNGAYLKPGLMEIPDKPRVLMVKAAKGEYGSRKPYVALMILYPTGYLYKTDFEADASFDGWELDARDRVLRWVLKARKASQLKQPATPAPEDQPAEHLPISNCYKAGDRVDLVCSTRLEYLLKSLPDRSVQAVIDFALHHISLDDYLDMEDL